MSTTIQYQLPEKAFVKISIYNLNGQIIETLVSQDKPAGYYNTIWDARQITSGVYIYRIDAGNFHDVRKCVIVK
jgi:flagellar hook assembly protein FlgD